MVPLLAWGKIKLSEDNVNKWVEIGKTVTAKMLHKRKDTQNFEEVTEVFGLFAFTKRSYCTLLKKCNSSCSPKSAKN